MPHITTDDDVKLYYEETGSGLPVVFVHEFAGDYRSYEMQMRYFGQRYRYTGAALTSDLAWLIGAAFAPLVALGLCANFGLAWLGAYLLSGALGTLVALGINRAMNYKS